MLAAPENVYERSAANRTLSDIDSCKSTTCNIPSQECSEFFDFSYPSLKSYIPTRENSNRIQCSFTYDLNLVEIHQVVKDRIYYLMSSVNNLHFEINELDNKILYSSLAPIDIKFCEHKKSKLNDEINKILINNYWEKYCEMAIPILNKYVILMSSEYKGIYEPGCLVTLDNDKIFERMKYIKMYFHTIESLDIIILNVIIQSKKQPLCPGCFSIISNDKNTSDESIFICKCGFVENNINHTTEYTDVNKISKSVNGNDENLTSIKKRIERFRGQSNDKYPKDHITTELNKIIQKYGFPNRNDVLNGYIDQPTGDVIVTMLKIAKLSEFYPIKDKIRIDFYGWISPEINSKQESEIIDLNFKIQEKYPIYKDKNRKTKINTEFMFYVLLKIVGVNVISSDFKIPISPGTLNYSRDTLYKILIALKFKEEDIPNMNV